MLQETADFIGQVNSPRKPRWLTLTGKCGVGKTYLAKGCYRIWMDTLRHLHGFDSEKQRLTGQRGQFVDWRKLCSAVREGSWGWVEDLCEDDFVILDDIGSEYDPSGFIASLIDRLFNARLRKWTMITCNLPIEQIAERLDARIASRMIRDGNVVVDCDTIDFALRPEAEVLRATGRAAEMPTPPARASKEVIANLAEELRKAAV